MIRNVLLFSIIITSLLSVVSQVQAEEKEQYEPRVLTTTITKDNPLNPLMDAIIDSSRTYNDYNNRETCAEGDLKKALSDLEKADEKWREAFDNQLTSPTKESIATFERAKKASEESLAKAQTRMINCALLVPNAEEHLGLIGTTEFSILQVVKNLLVGGTKIFLGILTLLSILMIVLGGGLWITAAGDESKATKAKAYIKWAVIGILVAGFSYAIVSLVIRLAFSDA